MASEKEQRRELEQLRSERLAFVADLEELKRQLHKLEVVRKELEAQIVRLEREKNALKRQNEAVL